MYCIFFPGTVPQDFIFQSPLSLLLTTFSLFTFEDYWHCRIVIVTPARICLKAIPNPKARIRIWIRLAVKSSVRTRTFRLSRDPLRFTLEPRRLAIELWRLTGKPWKFTMEPWRVSRPVGADSHHFAKEPDPDLHQSERKIRIRISNKGKSRIRIQKLQKDYLSAVFSVIGKVQQQIPLHLTETIIPRGSGFESHRIRLNSWTQVLYSFR
jgi:hypothetical protein